MAAAALARRAITRARATRGGAAAREADGHPWSSTSRAAPRSSSARHLSSAPQGPPDGLAVRSWVAALPGFSAVFCAAFAARYAYDSVFGTAPSRQSRDGQRVRIQILDAGAASSRVQGDIEVQELHGAVKHRVEKLQRLRADLKESSRRRLDAELQKLWESQFQPRIGAFQSWYFNYTTAYSLMALAARSAAGHALSLHRDYDDSIRSLVARDLEDYIGSKYEALVLRPELNEFKVRLALRAELRALQEELEAGLGGVERQFLAEVREKVDALQAGPEGISSSLRLELDWAAQLEKVRSIPAAFERSPVATIGLLGGGFLGGKALAASACSAAGACGAAAACAGKTAASAIGGKAGAAAFGKMASPFLVQLGLFAAGPLGLAAGLCADFALSKGIELVKKKEFQQDMLEILEATRLEWMAEVSKELDRTIDALIDESLDVALQRRSTLASGSAGAIADGV